MNLLHRFALWISVALLSAPPVRSETHWSGRLYTDQYLYTQGNRAGDFQQSSYSGWIDFESRSESGLGLHAVSQIDALARSAAEPSRSEARVRLREGYATFLGTGLEVRIGQQILPWGKSDGVNPTDYFSAKDYTLLNPDDEVRRLGAWSASVSLTPEEGASPLTFQLVVQGNFPQNRFLIPSGALPAGVSFESSAPTPALFGQNSIEVGGKVSWLAPGFDVSLSAFSGFSHSPQYRVDPASLAIRAFHAPETAVGADASFTWESWIFRMESALHMPANGTDRDPAFGLVQPWHWDSVVGLERPIGSDFRAQVQFLYRWHPYFAAPAAQTGNPVLDALLTGAGRANALILNYQRRANPGATFRLAYEPEGSDVSADCFVIGYFSQGQDYLVRPAVAWKPATNWKLTLGSDLYGGNSSRTLGALRDRSDIFFETRWLF